MRCDRPPEPGFAGREANCVQANLRANSRLLNPEKRPAALKEGVNGGTRGSPVTSSPVTQRAPSGARGGFALSRRVLSSLDVRRLQALVALHDVELDPLTLGQRPVALHRDRGVMDENVLATLTLDEAVALLVREPLHGALSQHVLPSTTMKRRPGHRAADLHFKR